MNPVSKPASILLFDGVCNLCSGAVQFILSHEKSETIYFASLQSDFGKKALDRYKIDPNTTDSLVFLEHDKAFVFSSAALRLTKHLKWYLAWTYLFLIVPSFIRNWVYKFIAKNRYKWFGKKEVCIFFHKGHENRFLQSSEDFDTLFN